MTRERAAWRERRHAHYLLRTGQASRRPPSQLELAAMVRAINYRDMNAFGIRNLVQLELDQLFTPQLGTLVPGVHLEPTLTLVAYAAWRRRSGFVKKVLRDVCVLQRITHMHMIACSCAPMTLHGAPFLLPRVISRKPHDRSPLAADFGGSKSDGEPSCTTWRIPQLRGLRGS